MTEDADISALDGDLFLRGIFLRKIVGLDAAFVIAPAQAENTFDFDCWDGAMDAANRMTLELIPFAQYK